MVFGCVSVLMALPKKSRKTTSTHFLVIYQNLVSRVLLLEKIETSFSTGHAGAEVSRVWSGEYV